MELFMCLGGGENSCQRLGKHVAKIFLSENDTY